MADNYTATQGSGTSFAADDVGAGLLVPRVKLVLGADGSNNGDGDGTAQRGLRVDPFESTSRVQQTPTGSSSPAYTAGDQYGGIMTIANAARFSGGGGELLLVTALCKDNLAPTFDLYFFDRSVTVSADNAAAVISDADMAFFQFGIQLTAASYVTALPGTPPNRVAQAPQFTQAANVGIMLPYVCQVTSLFCVAVIQSATTFVTTTSEVFSFTFRPD